MPARTSALLLALAGLATAPAARAGQVWVVDDDAGPGVDFTDLQPAIDAAAPGDVILVKDGLYGSFILDGKGLTLVAETDESVRVDGTWLVANIPAGSTALLRGLETAATDRQGLLLRDNAGAVWVEDCDIVAAHGTATYESPTNHGVEAIGSAEVVLARCTVTGGNGSNAGFFGEPFSGGEAILAISSKLAVLDCELLGGHGASAPYDDWYGGGHGGSGVWVADSTAIVAGGSAVGGYGGWGGEDYDLFVGQQCGDGGDGGSGVVVSSFHWTVGTVSSTVTVRDHAVTPGGGGGAMCGTPGDIGVPLFVYSGATHSVTELGGSARGFSTSSPVRGGTNARLEFTGSPGDVVLALAGFGTGWLDLGAQPAPWSIASIALGVGPWVLPGSGKAIQPVPVPTQAPSFAGASLPLQCVVLEVESGALTLAPPASLTLLNQSF